jgi:hypothetical protein
MRDHPECNGLRQLTCYHRRVLLCVHSALLVEHFLLSHQDLQTFGKPRQLLSASLIPFMRKRFQVHEHVSQAGELAS